MNLDTSAVNLDSTEISDYVPDYKNEKVIQESITLTPNPDTLTPNLDTLTPQNIADKTKWPFAKDIYIWEVSIR